MKLLINNIEADLKKKGHNLVNPWDGTPTTIGIFFSEVENIIIKILSQHKFQLYKNCTISTNHGKLLIFCRKNEKIILDITRFSNGSWKMAEIGVDVVPKKAKKIFDEISATLNQSAGLTIEKIYPDRSETNFLSLANWIKKLTMKNVSATFS